MDFWALFIEVRLGADLTNTHTSAGILQDASISIGHTLSAKRFQFPLYLTLGNLATGGEVDPVQFSATSVGGGARIRVYLGEKLYLVGRADFSSYSTSNTNEVAYEFDHNQLSGQVGCGFAFVGNTGE